MTYPDVTERFDGGTAGTHITTSNTTFALVDDGTNGGSKFSTGGVDGSMCAVAQIPGSPTTQDAGSSFYDLDYTTDNTHTITATDWTARYRFRINDSTSTLDAGWGLLTVNLGEVGKSPSTIGTGATDSVSLDYDAGTKDLQVSGGTGGGHTLSITGQLDKWLGVAMNGTNGNVRVWIYAENGGAFTFYDMPVTADLYRGYVQVVGGSYRSPNGTFTFDSDNFYAGATANDPFTDELPLGVIRNLVLNPSGEQSFDRAWNASNGTVESNVSWEV